MKLLKLDIQNFRQHLDSSITFSDGLTGIIGPNGAGKSTVLEAIAWALYGAPAVRGTNDTVRSKSSEGGAKVNVALTFELGGSIYRVTRTLDGSGRSGSAVLEAGGMPLRSGMSEVTAAVAKLLGMDYQAFFTSFFTGQKQLEFMSQLDGRQRATAISRMLGYERVTKARDQANEDRKGLQREIEGLERGLLDPEELKLRKMSAQTSLKDTKSKLDESEHAQKAALGAVDALKPLKEASDQKAKRHEEVSRRLEIDRADIARSNTRLSELRSELSDLENKRKELDSLANDLERYEQAGREHKQLLELQKHEGERQRLNGQAAALQTEVKRLESRSKQLANADDIQMRASIALVEAEKILQATDEKLQFYREQKVAHDHSIHAQIKQFEWQKKEIEDKRGKIVDAGADGKCPTCERPLVEELPTVIAAFDSQINEILQQMELLEKRKQKCEEKIPKLNALQERRKTLAGQVEILRNEKAKADSLVTERDSINTSIAAQNTELKELHIALEKIPKGFDQARFRELIKVGEELRPVRDKAIALKSSLDREPAVCSEIGELSQFSDAKAKEIALSEQIITELAFLPDEHMKLSMDFNTASANLNAALLSVERQRGEVNTAEAILKQIEREEQSYKARLEELKDKRSQRLHLQTLAEALDRLRADLNDRIRPELESIASELLSMMTDGRYNVLEINDNYQAMIRDDGELKPVISGGEDDIVNLALRLAISQMIADHAGQSLSLLVLDEVFGSLDDVRRENVITLLQNLKNRFEQIIVITHVESIHDAVDNCLWVEFEEKTKTSRLIDRSEKYEQPQVGISNY